MPGVREWAGQLLLRAPAPLRAMRDTPVIGALLHYIGHSVIPTDEKVWAQVESGPCKGVWLRLNPRTGQNYLRGISEIAIQEVVSSLLRPGMTFYDVGSNIGLFSLLAARIVGPSGKVFGFEPDQEVAVRLRENAQRNGFSNISLLEAGVWSTSGEQSFAASDLDSPDHGTGKFVAAGLGKPVACVALDDFVKTAAFPGGIKCDVEGAEVEVLRGAVGILKEHRTWLVCETHSDNSERECRTLLSGLNYSLQAIDTNHFLALP